MSLITLSKQQQEKLKEYIERSSKNSRNAWLYKEAEIVCSNFTLSEKKLTELVKGRTEIAIARMKQRLISAGVIERSLEVFMALPRDSGFYKLNHEKQTALLEYYKKQFLKKSVFLSLDDVAGIVVNEGLSLAEISEKVGLSGGAVVKNLYISLHRFGVITKDYQRVIGRKDSFLDIRRIDLLAGKAKVKTC